MSDPDKLSAELERDEGKRPFPYTDTTGHTSIAIGRNLSTKGLRPNEIALMLANDIAEACRDLDQHLAWWRSLDPVRQRVLANMAFNLGITRLMGFGRFLSAAHQHRWNDAAYEMGASRWALQVGERAVRLQAMMRTGAEP